MGVVQNVVKDAAGCANYPAAGLPGLCQSSGANCIVGAAATPPAGCGLCRGNGIPRYGDYSGIGCSPLLVTAAWAASTGVPPVINVFAQTIGLGLRAPLGTAHSGNFIQRHQSPNAPAEFDLLFAAGNAVTNLAHLVRNNHQSGFPWDLQPPLTIVLDESGSLPRPIGASVIHSRYPYGARAPSLHAAVRMRSPSGLQYLEWYSNDLSGGPWSDAGAIVAAGVPVSGVTGDPALIQSTRGDNGYFEMLVPQGRTLAHYIRDNDVAGTPWRRMPDVFGAGGTPLRGAPLDVALIQTNVRNSATNTGNLHAIVRMSSPRFNDYLAEYEFNAGTNTWRSIGTARTSGGGIPVSGTPALIQSTYGSSGTFEMLVPEGGNVAHYTREPGVPRWRRVASLYGAPVSPPPSRPVPLAVRSAAVALIQSSFNSPGNLEAIVHRRNATGTSSYLDAFYFNATDRNWIYLGRVAAINNAPVAEVTGF